MNTQYQNLDRYFREIESKFRGYVDQPHDPVAVELLQAVHNLGEFCEMQKNPHTIEDQLKRVVERLKEVGRESDEIMDYRHLRDIEDRLEKAREELRKFSNY